MKEDEKETAPPCRHRSLEMDESTGMWVCRDCWTTITKLKYDNNAEGSTFK